MITFFKETFKLLLLLLYTQIENKNSAGNLLGQKEKSDFYFSFLDSGITHIYIYFIDIVVNLLTRYDNVSVV